MSDSAIQSAIVFREAESLSCLFLRLSAIQSLTVAVTVRVLGSSADKSACEMSGPAFLLMILITILTRLSRCY